MGSMETGKSADRVGTPSSCDAGWELAGEAINGLAVEQRIDRAFGAIGSAARLGLAPDSLIEAHSTAAAEAFGPREAREAMDAILAAERPSVYLAALAKSGGLERHFKEVSALAGVKQDPIWHPEGDAWTHTMMVVDEAARLARENRLGLGAAEIGHLMIGALMHDVGKALTTEIKKGRIVSPGHEAAGAGPAAALLERLGYGEDAKLAVLACVTDHMKPTIHHRGLQNGDIDQRQYEKIMRRYAESIAPVRWQLVATMCEADFFGRGRDERPAFYAAGEAFREVMEKVKPKIEPLIKAAEILGMGVAPGPRVGVILREIEGSRARGEISSADEARELARKLVEGP